MLCVLLMEVYLIAVKTAPFLIRPLRNLRDATKGVFVFGCGLKLHLFYLPSFVHQ